MIRFVYPFVVGLDLSLRAPGLVLASGDPRGRVEKGINVDSALIRAGEDLRGPERLAVVSDAIWSWLAARDVKAGVLVVTEGYAFSRQMAHSLGELGGCVRKTLWERGCNLMVVPPSTLKRFTTGKGNDDKNVIIKKVFKRWNYDVDDDNQCDAFTCAMLGLVDQSNPSSWTEVERDILEKKVERYAGQGQSAWHSGSEAGKVSTRTRKRPTRGRVDLGSPVLNENGQGPRLRRRHDPRRGQAEEDRLRGLD